MSNIINVAIVLIAIFIGMAVVCSAIQEQIAWLTKQRGKQLFNGILNLVACHKELATAIWNSSLVKAGKAPPSYVDARNFTLSLWQNVHTVLGGTAGAAEAAAVKAPADALKSYIDRVQSFQPGTDPALKSVEVDLKQTLVSLLTSAENDYDKLLVATDQWFDAQMDRVAGWYKRWAQYLLIGIAFVVVLITGVDTLDAGKQLYNSSATQAAADDIRATVVQHQNDPDTNVAGAAIAATLDKELQGKLNLHVFHPIWSYPWSGASTAATPASGAPSPVPSTVPSLAPGSTQAGAPAGGHTDKTAGAMVQDTYVEPSLDWHLLGMLLTFIAVSLGAPFWFDVLKGIVNVRMAGTKPDDVPGPTKALATKPSVVVNSPLPAGLADTLAALATSLKGPSSTPTVPTGPTSPPDVHE